MQFSNGRVRFIWRQGRFQQAVRRLWDISTLQFQRSTLLYTWGLCSSLSSAWFILIPDIPADIGSLFLNAVQLLCKLFIPLFVIFGDFLRFLGFCLSKPLFLLFNNVM